MSALPSDRNRIFARLADFIVRMRWLWLATTIALVTLSAWPIANIWPLNPDARIFFAKENPDRIALDKFEATFNKNDNLMIAAGACGRRCFRSGGPEALIGEITERAWLPALSCAGSIR